MRKSVEQEMHDFYLSGANACSARQIKDWLDRLNAAQSNELVIAGPHTAPAWVIAQMARIKEWFACHGCGGKWEVLGVGPRPQPSQVEISVTVRDGNWTGTLEEWRARRGSL